MLRLWNLFYHIVYYSIRRGIRDTEKVRDWKIYRSHKPRSVVGDEANTTPPTEQIMLTCEISAVNSITQKR